MFSKILIEQFRLAKNLELKIGKNLTAICGQNGTMKSTLLACVGQPFGVGRGRKKENDRKEDYSDCLIVNEKFYSNITEIFKFSKEYDKPSEHKYYIYFNENSELMKNNMIYENPLQVKSRPRNDNEKNHIRIVTGKNRSAGKGNIRIPVIYLGLSRLYPIGETENLKEKTLFLTSKEIEFFKKNYSEILLSFDTDKYRDEIKLIDKNKKLTVGITTDTYDWQTISAGQDNVGKIIFSILEFIRLKEKLKEKYYGGILLIDELEATLYPGAQKKLIEFLNRYSEKYDIKIVFTTHSLEIIEEFLNNRKYRENSKINFLDKTKGLLINRTDISYDEIKKNILVEMKEESDNKIKVRVDIFFEDKEGEYLFKKIVSSNIKKYCELHPLEIGANNIALISNKILQLKKGIIIYDADFNEESSNYQGEFKKNFNKHKYSFFFPGKKSIEEEFLEILENLDDSDEFWNKCNCNTKQIFKKKKLEYIKNNKREEYKKWFLNEKKNFGKDGNELIKKYKEKYKEEIEKYTEKLKEKIEKNLKDNYGIIEKIKE